MESDDDYQLFSPPDQISPPSEHPKLKRLKKKAIRVSNDSVPQSLDEAFSTPPVDLFESQGMDSSEALGSEDHNEPLQSESPSGSFDEGNELNCDLDVLLSDGDRKKTNRALDFDDMVDGFDGKGLDENEGMDEIIADLKTERTEKKRLNEDGSNEKKEKKKKRVESVGDDTKTKSSNSNRRREEKERRAHLKQLHADSQRLLRETREAGFKPVPVVTKPISSILEKIRQRKLELSKKFIVPSNNYSITENHVSSRGVMMDVKDEDVSIDETKADKFGNAVQEETIACHVDVDCSLDVSHMDGSKESAMHSSHEDDPSHMALGKEESMQAFRAPFDDTEDLFCDSQTSDSKDELPDDQQKSPLEEFLAPSLPAMNLKFDSAPPDDISSDEEDNDKENIDPRPHRLLDNGCASPNGDPVKAFVDDEAVEEDDSDNDLFCFQGIEEDQDNEDLEELNDLIATGYEEKPTDNEKRNELHQKWLEQQDAAGTDNLLQRLNCGLKQKDAIMLEEEEEDDEDEDEDEDEFGDEAADDLVPTNVPQMNSKKAKQMICQMFSDRDDAYLSSDDEETEKKLVKQRLLDRAEEQATFLSPAEDESSREVFGLIKKLNIAPDTKRKAKTSSFFDTLLAGGNSSSSSSKSSFLGRASSHSFPSSHKQGTRKAQSFIFGRDDSNSRSSISISEDSSDTTPRENTSTRNATAKYSGSQSKSSTQSKKIAAETVSGSSLFEILKRSSLQSNPCNQDNMVGLTQTVFASFKIPKKPIKIEGRT